MSDFLGQLIDDRQRRNAYEESVYWYTVGLVTKRGQVVGSGSGVVWNGIRLILTAKHVVKEAASLSDIVFFGRPDGPIPLVSPGETITRQLPHASIPETLPVAKIVSCEWEDLAAIVLGSGNVDKFNLRFHELEPLAAMPVSDTTIVIIGFPTEASVSVSGGLNAAFPQSEWTAICQPKESDRSLKDFDMDRHFLVSYSAAGQQHPMGVSGAGGWCESQCSDAKVLVWSPHIHLAGVCTHYFKKKGLLKLVRIETVIHFLEEALPTRSINI